MPDLTVGSWVLALDTPPTVADTQDDTFGATNTTFGVGFVSGTYNDCGTAFLAPTSGRVEIKWSASMSNNATVSTVISAHVREGGTVGAGADVEIATTPTSIFNVGSDARRYGTARLIEGLTPGDTYNVRLEHRVTSNTGSISSRHVIVTAVP